MQPKSSPAPVSIGCCLIPNIPLPIFEHEIADLAELTGKEMEHLGRLGTPLFKARGANRFKPVDWEFALSHAAQKLAATDPQRSFFYSSGRSSNEAGFLFQLLARAYGHERPDAMTTQLPGTGPAPTPDQEDTPDHTPDHGPDHEPAHEAGLAEDAPLGGQVDGGEPESAAPDSVVGLSATAVWGDERSAEFRNRWREAQLAFVDDPRAATTDAKELVSAAIEALTVALNEQRSTLDAWESGDGDTEQLRQAMRQYRVFFDHVLGL